jgi:hypothetical protein
MDSPRQREAYAWVTAELANLRAAFRWAADCSDLTPGMEEVHEVELVVQRVAALDLGKATLEACMRVPHPSKPGRRMQEIRGYATTTAALLEMAIWLRQWGIERVVMESTSDYVRSEGA